MASNSHVDSLISPNNEHVQNFMAVLITCKSHEDLIKNEIAIVETTFSYVYEALKGCNSCQLWKVGQNQTCPVPVTCP